MSSEWLKESGLFPPPTESQKEAGFQKATPLDPRRCFSCERTVVKIITQKANVLRCGRWLQNVPDDHVCGEYIKDRNVTDG